jgi:hypothetical protein
MKPRIARRVVAAVVRVVVVVALAAVAVVAAVAAAAGTDLLFRTLTPELSE